MDGYDALLLVFFAQALDSTVYEKSPRMWRNFDSVLQVSATGPVRSSGGYALRPGELRSIPKLASKTPATSEITSPPHPFRHHPIQGSFPAFFLQNGEGVCFNSKLINSRLSQLPLPPYLGVLIHSVLLIFPIPPSCDSAGPWSLFAVAINQF